MNNVIISIYFMLFNNNFFYLFMKDISSYGQVGDERDCGLFRYETSAPIEALN